MQNPREIQALLASFRQSGLGLERFARTHQIPPGRLHYWFYQKYRALTRKRSAKDLPLFQEVKFEGSSSLVSSWVAEVTLAQGLSVRFRATTDPGWIGAVIQALQRPC